MSAASRTEAIRTATFLVSPAAVTDFTNCAVFSLAGFVMSITRETLRSSSSTVRLTCPRMRIEIGEACDVAAGMSQAVDQSLADRIWKHG